MMMDKVDWCRVGKSVQVKNYPINKWKVREVTDDNGVRIECEGTSTWVCRTEIEPWGSHPMNHEHQDHKEGEGVEWDEPTEGFHYINGQALPPAGVECEVSIEGGISTTCKVISYYDDMVWLDLGSRHPVRMIQECRFRPIQSHRDKCIEAAAKHLNAKGWVSRENELMSLYDAGFLRLPNDKEGE